MGIGKWIGGIAGFMAFGPLGALAGYALGALVENVNDKIEKGGGVFEQNGGEIAEERYGQRNSFLFSLLVMASYIIRADGKVMHSEMEYVRRFLRLNFGSVAESEGNQILLRLFDERKRMDSANPNAFRTTIQDCGAQIRNNMTYEQRLQLLEFLATIAKSDGNVCKEEVAALKEVAFSMGLSDTEVDSMLSLGGESLDEAYKVLEIDSSATDDEVKAAYRKMALKHHPDRVATLGEDVRKAAEEKFQKINSAKEKIFSARGMK